MKARFLTWATAAAVLFGVFQVPAHAQQAITQASGCLKPVYGEGQMSWFLGFNPADDILSSWCRLQSLPGAVRFNVLFPVTKVHRSWDTSFDGQNLPATKIVEIIQSLLPTADGPVKDAQGMEFSKVLKNVVQLSSKTAPDDTPLGFAPEHPAAKELVLWEPVVLRVKPVALAGQEFTLIVTFRPNLGLLALGLQQKATDVRLQGWKGRLPAGSVFGGKCADEIPSCGQIPEVATFHAPWLIEEVRLEATGDNMTVAAMTIMQQLAATRSTSSKTVRPNLNEKSGSGSLTLIDDVSVMEMKAEGSPSGTKHITISWKAKKGNTGIRTQLEEAGKIYRAGKASEHKGPRVPDSMGLL